MLRLPWHLRTRHQLLLPLHWIRCVPTASAQSTARAHRRYSVYCCCTSQRSYDSDSGLFKLAPLKVQPPPFARATDSPSHSPSHSRVVCASDGSGFLLQLGRERGHLGLLRRLPLAPSLAHLRVDDRQAQSTTTHCDLFKPVPGTLVIPHHCIARRAFCSATPRRLALRLAPVLVLCA